MAAEIALPDPAELQAADAAAAETQRAAADIERAAGQIAAAAAELLDAVKTGAPARFVRPLQRPSQTKATHGAVTCAASVGGLNICETAKPARTQYRIHLKQHINAGSPCCSSVHSIYPFRLYIRQAVGWQTSEKLCMQRNEPYDTLSLQNQLLSTCTCHRPWTGEPGCGSSGEPHRPERRPDRRPASGHVGQPAQRRRKRRRCGSCVTSKRGCAPVATVQQHV